MGIEMFDDKKVFDKEKVKEPIYRHMGVTGIMFAVFRVSKKYKSMASIRHYQNHMERLIEVPNADKLKQNKILIGSCNIVGDVKRYIEGIKTRKNAVIARDLLLTASPAFFKNISDYDFKRWIDLNVKWLKDNFGDNCVYATLHMDETTPHISALIVPKFYNKKKNIYCLQNYKYFDGIEKMRGWQDEYSKSMKSVFKSLNRGIKFSKAKHIEIRHYYTMINEKLNEEDIQSVCSKAVNSDLMTKQVKNLQATLLAYREYSKKTESEKNMLTKTNESILKGLETLQKDKKVYGETIKALSEIYKIPQNAVIKAIRYVEDNLEKNQSKSLELKLNKKQQ